MRNGKLCKQTISYVLGVAMTTCMCMGAMLAVSSCGIGSSVEGNTDSGKESENVQESISQDDANNESSEEVEEPDKDIQEAEIPESMEGIFLIAYRTYTANYDGDKQFSNPENDISKGVLVNGQFTVLTMNDEYAGVYPKLYETITKNANDRISKTQENENEIVSQAKSDYEEAIDSGYDFYGPYYYHEDVSVIRADDTVLSVINSYDQFTGGFHNLFTQHGCTYDTQTGEEVKIGDIVKCSEDELNKILSDKLHAIEVDEYQYDGLEETLSHYKFNPVISDTEDYDKLEFAYNWYLAADGMHIIFNVYDIAAYVYGASDVVIGYDEYDGVIDERFMPDKSKGYVIPNITFVGGDGAYEDEAGKDEIRISYTGAGEYKDGYVPAKAITLTMSGNSATIEKACNVTDDYVDYYVVHKADGTDFIYVIIPEPEDCYDLFVFETTDNIPKAVRAETYKKNLKDLENGFKGYYVFTNPEKEYDEEMGDTVTEAVNILENQADENTESGGEESVPGEKSGLEDGVYSTNLTKDTSFSEQYVEGIEFTENGISIEGSFARMEDDDFTFSSIDYGTYYLTTDGSTEYISGGGDEENNYMSRDEFKEYISNLMESGLGLVIIVENGLVKSIGIYS